ncbi:MAG: RNA polymerase sigma factor [Pirellulales bacterium]|nr:RNA polymerase sigma factor [Pirellulales bacterium]
MLLVATETTKRGNAGVQSLAEASDRELLRQFVQGEERAFTALVQRHASLVQGVCQRVLRRASEAEDAFQATFMVLARKANSWQWQESIAGWLHQTALRSSLKLRGMSARRRQVEQNSPSADVGVESLDQTDPQQVASLRELAELLDQELANLPAKLREVMLLCQIEGLSRDDAAARLAISPSAVKDRLERARENLRRGLTRRGVTLSATLLAAVLLPQGASAAGLTALAGATAQSATAFATGSLAAGTVSSAVTLAQGVLNIMGLEKLKYAAICLMACLTAGTIAYGMLQDAPDRFEKGLRGEVISVQTSAPASVTVRLEHFETPLSLGIAPDAKCWISFETHDLSGIKPGQYVALNLAEDHRTVKEIHVQGEQRQVQVQAVSAGKITVKNIDEGDEEQTAPEEELKLAEGAIVRIGNLPATLAELKPGMQIPVEFGPNGKTVNAIEADAAPEDLYDGELLSVDTASSTLKLKCDKDDQPLEITFHVRPESQITLDGKRATLTDLKPGSVLYLREDKLQNYVPAIRATSPEPDSVEVAMVDEPEEAAAPQDKAEPAEAEKADEAAEPAEAEKADEGAEAAEPAEKDDADQPEAEQKDPEQSKAE